MNSRILIMRLLAACLLAAALSAAAAARANAGTYVVVGCSDLNGAAVRPTDGWYLAAGGYPSRNDCRTRGGLFTTSERSPQLFRFDAPAGTTISRLVSTFRAHLSGAAPWAVPTFVVEAAHGSEWEYIPPARGYIGAEPVDWGGTRAGDAHHADAVRIGVRCELAGPCTTGGQPWARFTALAIELDDSRAPAVGVSSPAGHLRGTVGVAVTARDAGGGIYERAIELDGRRLTTARPCLTVPASLGTQRHVTQRVPCPLDAPASFALSTTKVADGLHSLVARVEDVAGNVRTAETRIVVDNRPPTAGAVVLAGDPAEALTAQPSGFAGEDVTYAYRWERCGDNGCAEIGGAVSRTYRTRSRDAGLRLRAVVAATDGGGTVRVASAQSGVVPPPASAASSVPDGRLTAWIERGRRRLRRSTVTWPARVRIRGRLTDLHGQGLPRTPVRMLERTAGRRWRPITGVRTRRDGRLTTFTRSGPSRQVRLAYGTAIVTLRLAVRAAVRARIQRRGPLTVVSGRLQGGHVPRAGLRLRLQSRGATVWRTRAVLRTDGLGRFSATGRAPTGARLRIVVPAQRGYPYARGVARL